MTTLRERLKVDTRIAHNRVDECVSQFDLSEFSGMSSFVRAHALVFSTLKSSCVEPANLIDHRARKADQDMAALGLTTETPMAKLDHDQVSGAGLTYVIAGAHLGSRVLSKRWIRTADDRVRAASHLLLDGVPEMHWRNLVGELRSLPPTGERADRIVHSANAAFDLFARAFCKVSTD